MLNAEVRVTGKSAHSARPWTGVNAIERAAPWLAQVTKFEPRPVSLAGAEFIETLQVTTLHAGKTRNVIPAELVANLNYRFTPDHTLEEAEHATARDGAARVRVHRRRQGAGGEAYGDHPEVRAVRGQFGARVAGKQGWTDVARFTAAGIPAFNFGPGIPSWRTRSRSTARSKTSARRIAG